VQERLGGFIAQAAAAAALIVVFIFHHHGGHRFVGWLDRCDDRNRGR
jgi:hypothetical protein